MMTILVACEESQEVTKAFRALGHEAFSCDILECSGGHPEWHLQREVEGLLDMPWDMVLAFPPCTHLARSGGRWFEQKRRDGRQRQGINFFMQFTSLVCKRVAIENPIGIMSTLYRRPDQIIQPWQYGHPETKATCLWLKGLPLLVSTNIVLERKNKVWKAPDSKNRRLLRSKTYPNIAKAMAAQWGTP